VALLPTSQPGSVGLEVVPGPGGGLFLSVHTSHGYLTVLLTSQEAHRASEIILTHLMSPRESNASPSGLSGPPFHPRPPR